MLFRSVAAGVAPGAAVGRVLKRAEAEWLGSGCAADRAALKARLPALVAAELGDGEP